MTIDEIALLIGYSVMIGGGLAVLSGLVVLVAHFVNKATHIAVDSYGGIEVFKEFVEWYREKK